MVPKSNFNGTIEQSKLSEFSSPKQLPKNISHAKSSSLNQEYTHNNLSTVDDDEEQQTAMMLPHLMFSKSTYLPSTTSPPVSSSSSSFQTNSSRPLPNIKNQHTENLDIYEDPSQHYGMIGNPLTVTSFQTSTPVRNTMSNNLRDNIANRGKPGLSKNSAPSNSLSGIGYGNRFLAFTKKLNYNNIKNLIYFL